MESDTKKNVMAVEFPATNFPSTSSNCTTLPVQDFSPSQDLIPGDNRNLDDEKPRTWKYDPKKGGLLPEKWLTCCWIGCDFGTLEGPEMMKTHLLSTHGPLFSEAEIAFRSLARENYECGVEGCGMEFPTVEHLKCHLQMHAYQFFLEEEGLVYYNKTKEEKGFAFLSHCGYHIPTPNKIDFLGAALECHWNECEWKFLDPWEFFAHIERHIENIDGKKDRNKEKKIECLWINCGKGFERRAYLREHLKHHSGYKPIACPFCGSYFCSKKTFVEHFQRKMSTAQSRLKCFMCQKNFFTAPLLKEHIQKHIKKHKCMFCPMTCVSPADLKEHIKSIHKNDKDYYCTICNKGFIRLSHLQVHMAKHTNSHPFQCSKCDRKYKYESALNDHLRIVHPEKGMDPFRYLCHKCPKKFTRGACLGKHCLTKHNVKLPPGFKKFSFKRCEDGYFRLQTDRYESLKLSHELREEEERRREEEAKTILHELILDEAECEKEMRSPIPLSPNIPPDLRNTTYIHVDAYDDAGIPVQLCMDIN